jgi:hypothetical protein
MVTPHPRFIPIPIGKIPIALSSPWLKRASPIEAAAHIIERTFSSLHTPESEIAITGNAQIGEF